MSQAKRSAFCLAGLGITAVLVLTTPRAVHAVGAALVQVTNTTANPVITSRLDDSGRIPYQTTIASAGGCNNCSISLPAVPPNHRLVIQPATIIGELTGPGAVLATIAARNGLGSFFIPGALTGSAQLFTYAQDEPMLVFVDSGEQHAQRSSRKAFRLHCRAGNMMLANRRSPPAFPDLNNSSARRGPKTPGSMSNIPAGTVRMVNHNAADRARMPGAQFRISSPKSLALQSGNPPQHRCVEIGVCKPLMP
jgi:hypothetical protein